MVTKWVTLVLFALTASAHAGQADVVNVEVDAVGQRTFRFAVTVRHADAGWDHYADRWQIVAPDGQVLAARVLHHPHVDEQPFTRSLSGVQIPESVSRVSVRAGDSVHGFGGREIQIDLPASK